jgi:hypothetical protein
MASHRTSEWIERELEQMHEAAARGLLPLHVAVEADARIRDGLRIFDGVRDEIREAMARTYYAEWLRNVEEDVRLGGEPEDAELPEEGYHHASPTADKLIDKLERRFGMPIEWIYFLLACPKLRHRREPTIEDFGHNLAMQAMGHGVGWEDDHELPPGLPRLNSLSVEYWGP